MPCVPSSVGWRASKTFMKFLLRLKLFYFKYYIAIFIIVFHGKQHYDQDFAEKS